MGDYKVLEIRDHGPGFSPEIKDHLSELFTYSGKYRDNSKGIGLPIVKMIMDSHGGGLLLENHPQGGTIVKLLFKNSI
jgi:signal transduction histidine kinase